MFALRLSLLALAGTCLAVSSRTHGSCTTATYGVIDGIPHSLPRQIMLPGKNIWEVDIETVCPDEIGMLVVVCDWEWAPSVRVQGLHAVHVHRRGRGAAGQPATLDAVVYCAATRPHAQLRALPSPTR